MGSKRNRILIGVSVAIALSVTAGLAALGYAARLLKTQVQAALGPDSEIGSIRIEHYSIVVGPLRIKAPDDWPADDAFRAARVVIEPDVRALFSGEVRIGGIIAENVYLSLFRDPQGRRHVLPGLLEKPGESAKEKATADERTAEPERAGTPVTIRSIELRNGVVELFDASVRTKPHRIRIEDVYADLGPMAFPALDTTAALNIGGIVKGPHRDGRVSVSGIVRFSNLDLDVTTSLEGIDLVCFEPYLLQSSETGVKRGTLDLDIRSKVANRVLTAPGTMTLSDLDLADSTFMGLPRQAVLAALRSRDGKITVRFELEGRLDDPKFALRENLATRAGAALAESLGVNMRGLATTVGGATQQLTDKLGELFRR